VGSENNGKKMKITYNSTNKGKRAELEEFYSAHSVWFTEKQIEFEFQKIEVQELQNGSLEEIVKHKTKMAYEKIKRPVLVEHTCLCISALHDLPGHLTGEMWNRLGGYKICELVNSCSTDRAEAVTMLGYCDGKKIKTFRGACRGRISKEPRGNSDFQWDTIFIPDGQEQHDATFAEMTESKSDSAKKCTKSKLSMRTKALEAFLGYLKDNGRDESLVKRYIQYQDVYDEAVEDIKKSKNKNKVDLKNQKKKKSFAEEKKCQQDQEHKAQNSNQSPDQVQEVEDKNQEKNLALFVGAGLSRNIELPTWNGLINEIGEVLGYEENLFFGKGNVLELASFADKTDITHLIREVFRIDDSKEDSKESKTRVDDSEVKKKIKKIVEEKYMKPFKEKIKASPYYSFIARLHCDTIYTTNYDRCIEEALIYAYSDADDDFKIATTVHSNEFDEVRIGKRGNLLEELSKLKKSEKKFLEGLKDEESEEELEKLRQTIKLIEQKLGAIYQLVEDKLRKVKMEKFEETSGICYSVNKFHGDLKYESDLVLSSESYDKRYEEIILNLKDYEEKVNSKIEGLSDNRSDVEEKNKNNNADICTERYRAKLIDDKDQDETDKKIYEGGVVKNLNLSLLNDLCTKRMLFIGYGFGDCDVNKLITCSKALREKSEDASKKELKHYAFLISPNEVKEKWLEENGIIPIVPASGKTEKELEDFLRKISD
jgi:XTP/dITP diphosphohydrolase